MGEIFGVKTLQAKLFMKLPFKDSAIRCIYNCDMENCFCKQQNC